MSGSRSGDDWVRLRVLEEARDDVRALDRALQGVVADLVVELHRNPYRGDPLEEAAPFPILAECRRIRFDEANWSQKPRYRLIYRNEPHDGSPHEVVVLAVGRREKLIAYVRAAGRVGEEIRQRGRGRPA